jgi:hypothetical protein
VTKQTGSGVRKNVYAELLVIRLSVAIANTSIAEFCPSHQKQRCPQVSVQCRRIVNLYGRPLKNLRQGMDAKRALSLINSICRCGGVCLVSTLVST